MYSELNESKNMEGKLLGLQSGGCDCENQWPRNDFEKITYAELLKSSRITVGLGWPTVMVNPGLNLSRNVETSRGVTDYTCDMKPPVLHNFGHLVM